MPRTRHSFRRSMRAGASPAPTFRTANRNRWVDQPGLPAPDPQVLSRLRHELRVATFRVPGRDDRAVAVEQKQVREIGVAELGRDLRLRRIEEGGVENALPPDVFGR